MCVCVSQRALGFCAHLVLGPAACLQKLAETGEQPSDRSRLQLSLALAFVLEWQDVSGRIKRGPFRNSRGTGGNYQPCDTIFIVILLKVAEISSARSEVHFTPRRCQTSVEFPVLKAVFSYSYFCLCIRFNCQTMHQKIK